MKKFLKVLLGLILILVIAGGVLYVTDNRYSLTLKSYIALKSAEAVDLDFKGKLGSGGMTFGVSGNSRILIATEQSLTNVGLDVGFIPVNVDIYTEKKDIYYKLNLFNQGWQKGVPTVQEEEFNPEVYGKALEDVSIIDMLGLASTFDKGEEGNLMTFHTDDAFTLEQVETFLVDSLSLDRATVEEWNLTGYDLRVAFNKDTDLLDSVVLDLQQQVKTVDFETGFSVTIKGLDTFSTIDVPADLTR